MQLVDLTNNDTNSRSFPTIAKQLGTSKPKAVERLEEELEALLCKIYDGRFIPCSSTGKQISPNSMKTAIRKHLAETGKNQTTFVKEINVNSNSFGKFMNMAYKDQWSAVQNGTYRAAGVYLAKYKIHKQIDDLMSKKAGNALPTKKSKSDMDNQLASINSVVVGETPVFANCDEVRQMINKYLISSGVSQTRWLNSIGVASNSLACFQKMKGKGAGASNMTYHLAWRFFEKKRILENKPKSDKRLEQEARWGPEGFALEVYDYVRLYFLFMH